MPIPVVCACSAKLKVADHLLDLDVRCPKCGTIRTAAAPTRDSPYYGLYAATPRSAAKGPPPAASPEDVLARSPLSDGEKRRLGAELDGDERLVWAGKPDPALAVRRLLMVSAGLVCAAVFMGVIGGLIWYIESSQGRDLGGMGLIALAVLGSFGLVLLGAAVALPLFNRWRCGRSFYALTTGPGIV